MTLHNTAKKEEIAKTVLLFGNPTHVTHLAHKYLRNVKKVSDVRYACFFTGEYNGKKYTFGTHGMGLGSCAIYFYELYAFYEVENIIRIGSTGAFSKTLNKGDTVLVKEAFSDDKTLTEMYKMPVHEEILYPTPELFSKLGASAKKLGYTVPELRTLTCDVYYGKNSLDDWMNISKADVVEMETWVLFFLAKFFKKNAACLLTVVNLCYPVTEGTARLTRQEQMDMRCPAVEIALNAGIEP